MGAGATTGLRFTSSPRRFSAQRGQAPGLSQGGSGAGQDPDKECGSWPLAHPCCLVLGWEGALHHSAVPPLPVQEESCKGLAAAGCVGLMGGEEGAEEPRHTHSKRLVETQLCQGPFVPGKLSSHAEASSVSLSGSDGSKNPQPAFLPPLQQWDQVWRQLRPCIFPPLQGSKVLKVL